MRAPPCLLFGDYQSKLRTARREQLTLSGHAEGRVGCPQSSARTIFMLADGEEEHVSEDAFAVASGAIPICTGL